jgi:hypothetical protein
MSTTIASPSPGTEEAKLFGNQFKKLDQFEMTVPADYDPARQLGLFRAAHITEFSQYSDHITDEKFFKPTIVLAPGQKLAVEITEPEDGTSSKENLDYLRSRKALFVGVQGTTLVYQLAKEKIPLDSTVISFDQQAALGTNLAGDWVLPGISRYTDGTFRFGLTLFDTPSTPDVRLLAFFKSE